MHLQFSLTLSAPRERAWRAFSNFENLRRWQASLVEYTPLSGNPGEAGATTRLVYREAGHQIEVVETVTSLREPESVDATYDGSHGSYTLHNRFVMLTPEQTRWDMEAKLSFRGAARLLAPMLKGTIERRMRSDAERFRELLEGGELET